MATFQYYFHKLPCFDCKKTQVDTDLGWLTEAMKDEIVAQATALMAAGNVEPDFAVNVTCAEEDARAYLLLNYYGYSEEELANNEVEADDEQAVAEEIAELEGNLVFEHEIALQSCTDCGE
ncbi:hypothetical protein ACFFLZ_07300 [Photobacterium aphoticum]|uniref:Uncharacterized protein n=1 Tax=Photobacterium aphoticum TaxID=754436 RepID=A0A090QKC3_9GAMM|nr:hypothetical protein [Photobacterium aphoticum]KLV01170.1 hypothetical protein ABT58_08510 [Photobacterium aphoticum]PSU56097.1 hypothetical protein C9I90_13900 [Photobacterium aphoticum]GAL02269.1 hypothetical protein JCM19237_5162 [Photobacterium aphoticum]GHA49426.1 hypothetical protein GCM10007086_24010 [Photobacterium aphoticum]